MAEIVEEENLQQEECKKEERIEGRVFNINGHLINSANAISTNVAEMENTDNEVDGVGPKKKIAKLFDSNEEEKCLDFKMNINYNQQEFIKMLSDGWLAKADKDFKDFKSEVEIYGKPFQLTVLPNLLQRQEMCQLLVNEMVENVNWSRKQMDLYEFYQSADLSSMVEFKYLHKFLQFLRRVVRPWLEKITQLKLDYVSASCSMYTCGDYLLVHDDLLKDRQIAFVYYLSPWPNNTLWKKEYGGCLEIFDCDEKWSPQFPVRRRIPPRNNQFVFFKVGCKSFHQVGEVTTYDFPRLTINGWFHGATNTDHSSDSLGSFIKIPFKAATSVNSNLETLLNEVYLKPTTKRSIQKRVEDNSEICLYEFFRRETFEDALKQLLNDNNLKWSRKGPANVVNYEVLDLQTATSTIEKLINLFSSVNMFALLKDYTDLDLVGPNAKEPCFSIEVQRWSHGDYTVLGDGVLSNENTLDLMYYLNAAEGAAIVTYLSPEEEGVGSHEKPYLSKKRRTTSQSDVDSLEGEGFNDEDENSLEDDDEAILLTITSVDNALNIVYRCEGTTKFTKYISRNTPLENGPVFVICCSYKE